MSMGRKKRYGYGKDYAAGRGGYSLLIVERSFKEVLELVQEHVRVRGRNDRTLLRQVAPQDPSVRCCPLVCVEPADELHFGLWAQQHPKRAQVVEVAGRRWRLSARAGMRAAASGAGGGGN